MTSFGRELLNPILRPEDHPKLTHVADLPARPGTPVSWPNWVPEPLRETLADRGVKNLWSHQAETANLAHSGSHVVVATGTASGKSLGYTLPVLTALAQEPNATAMYLSPTKALGADQLSTARSLALKSAPAAGVASYDGDTPAELRRAIRDGVRWVFTNPDMVHAGILPRHQWWTRLLRNLRYLVIDECHAYRGVFGAHISLVIRRLLRIARRYGANPTVILASATTADPAGHASTLIGEPVQAITEDGAPVGERTIALWEPGMLPELVGENGAPVRRPATSESADIMARLLAEGARTLTFARSRRGSETIAMNVRERLELDGRPDLAGRVESYRAGYLAEDRREIERRLDEGELLGVAATNALELGIDIGGLDAVVEAGFPGTVASFWQQAGRAGRRGQGSLVMLVARDDPMDTYLVHHPDALLGRPVEKSVFDPTNPYVLRGHLYCAAVEKPLLDAEIDAWHAHPVASAMLTEGWLRRKDGRWFPTDRPDLEDGPQISEAHSRVHLRGSGDGDVAIVDGSDGRLLGTIDGSRARTQVHDGAVYLHRGESYVVDQLDLENSLAVVHPERPDWSTSARVDTDIRVLSTVSSHKVRRGVYAALVEVEVEHRVSSYMRRMSSGEILDIIPLDYPPERLVTRSVAYTVTDAVLREWGVEADEVPGALHAAEHAAIGMLPLVATCDRWDIGGVSTAMHLNTGLPTVFVYDGHEGGAGFADRGYEALPQWIRATRDAVTSCSCDSGCPSCIQSPKCGNGNEPLSKPGAVKILSGLTEALDGLFSPESR